MSSIRHPDPFAVVEDDRIAAVLRRLYKEANRQHFSVVRHLSRHALSFIRGKAVEFPMTEMARFWGDCPASAPMRQIEGAAFRRVLVSS